MSSCPRVVDFSTHFSGPIASRHLVQLGADVVKVEHPRHGDGNRFFPPLVDGVGLHHLVLNGGTRSVALEAGSELWKRTVPALARWADVVIVGKQPAAARRLGIDYASLLAHNGELVYCLISGYGLDGDWADLPAHGLNMDALAGALALEREGDTPRIPADYRSAGTTMAGVQAALGIFAALYRRSLGGGGQVVHVSIWESALATLWRDTASYAGIGSAWPGYRDLGSRYAVYGASDGGALLVCPIERRFWERFCDALDLPAAWRAHGDWSGGADLGTGYDDERAAIAARVRTRPRDAWAQALQQAGVPVAPVLDWREAMASEHARANGVMTHYSYRGREVHVPAAPVSVTAVRDLRDGSDAALAAAHRAKAHGLEPAPDLGAHNDAVLAELGIQP